MDGIGNVQADQIRIQQQMQQVQTAGAKQAASMHGAQTSGKAREAEEEAKPRPAPEGGDTVSIGEIEAQDIYQAQMGVMQQKIKEERRKRETGEEDDLVSLEEGERSGEEVQDLGVTEEAGLKVEAEKKIDSEAILNRDTTELTGDLPEDIRNAARAIVENQIDPVTHKPTKALGEMKPIPERGLLELLPESRVSIADIHDSNNEPVLIEEDSPTGADEVSAPI